jgi:hypothetical protein
VPSSGRCGSYFLQLPLGSICLSEFRDLLAVDWNLSSFAELAVIFNRFRGISKGFLWMLFTAQS